MNNNYYFSLLPSANIEPQRRGWSNTVVGPHRDPETIIEPQRRGWSNDVVEPLNFRSRWSNVVQPDSRVQPIIPREQLLISREQPLRSRVVEPREQPLIPRILPRHSVDRFAHIRNFLNNVNMYPPEVVSEYLNDFISMIRQESFTDDNMKIIYETNLCLENHRKKIIFDKILGDIVPISNDDDHGSCPVCMDVYKDQIFISVCNHTLCISCVQKWFIEQKKSSCPICRNVLLK